MSESKATRHRWDDLPKEALKEDLSRRLISTDRMMLAQVFLEQGCVVPRHAQAEALETTLDVDIFAPPRQDWLDGSDVYLRNPS